MPPRPSPARLPRPHVRRAATRAGVRIVVALALAACAAPRDGDGSGGRGASVSAGTSVGTSTHDSLAVVGVAPDESGAALVGRLLDDIVPDSGIQASWALYPTERQVGILHVTVAGAHYLLADTLVGYDGPKARWRIRQAQRIIAPAAGEAYVTSCALAGRDAADGSIVARVTLTPDDTLPSPHAAWRFDPITWRFHSFPTNALSCYNEGGGP